MGTVAGIDYEDYTIDLSGGGSIFLYTDGVTDAKDPDGARFGTDRMLELLNSKADMSTQETIDLIKKEINTFARDTEQFDDITAMCVKYKGKK